MEKESTNEKSSKIVSISMDQELFESFDKLRISMGVSRSLMIQLLIIKWLKENVRD